MAYEILPAAPVTATLFGCEGTEHYEKDFT